MPEEFDHMRSSLFWWNCAYLSLSLSLYFPLATLDSFLWA